jgi:RNA polymerase sigma-70 factor (ECF subfamily)
MPSANARALLGTSQPQTRSAGCDDSALVRQARAGHWEAFAQLAGRYDGPILALTLRLTGSEREAEELFRTALLKAYRELHRYRFQCSFYVWIYRAVADSCLCFLQTKRGDPAHGCGSHVEAALDQLSPRERIVVELKHSMGLRLETIAAILEISEAAARNTFVAAMMMLRLACAEKTN